MKLRIKDDTLRIRLSQTEVHLLEKNGHVISACHFPGNCSLKYEILQADSWAISFRDGHIRVMVPSDTLSEFFIPEKIGFDHRLENGMADGMYVLIEKDFQCLTERLHEDESDLFPNPNATC